MTLLVTSKKRLQQIYQCGILILVLTACQPSGFQMLLDKTYDASLKSKLNDFSAGGVEQSWPSEFDNSKLVEAALKYKGVQYKSGGTNRHGMDCSGLLFRAANDIGLALPHRSADIARYGHVVPTKSRLRKGDFVFFTGNGNRLITHSGIMIDHNHFIHVSSSKGCVISSFDQYWSEHFLFGTR